MASDSSTDRNHLSPLGDPEQQAEVAIDVMQDALARAGYEFREGKPGVYHIESPNGWIGYAVIGCLR